MLTGVMVGDGQAGCCVARGAGGGKRAPLHPRESWEWPAKADGAETSGSFGLLDRQGKKQGRRNGVARSLAARAVAFRLGCTTRETDAWESYADGKRMGWLCRG